jgi:hypothetical protein
MIRKCAQRMPEQVTLEQAPVAGGGGPGSDHAW